MAAERAQWEWAHVGAGTTLAVTYLSLIPGFLPALVLLVLLTAVVVLPTLLLGLAAALVMVPPYGLWRLTTRRRRRRQGQAHSDRSGQTGPPLDLPQPPPLGPPNLPIHIHHAEMAHVPAVLSAYMGLRKAITEHGSLDPKTHTAIMFTVASLEAMRVRAGAEREPPPARRVE
jgi:hypothetical protein